MVNARRRRKHRYLVLNDLEYVREIDSGSYSTVHLYRLKDNREKRYAVKEIHGTRDNGIVCISEFLILKNIVNRSIIGYRGYQIIGNTLYIILENADTSLLRHCKEYYTKTEGRRSISKETMAKWIGQIAGALFVLHDSNIVHCDVKSDNILMFKNENVKLADFGMSTLDGSGPHLTNATSFRAPEIWGDMIVRKSIDMWSFGCVLYDIYYCESLFGQMTRRNRSRMSRSAVKRKALMCIDRWTELRHKMIAGTYDYRTDVALYKSNEYTPPSISPAFDPSKPLPKLIIKLLDPNPDTRITAHDVLTDPFVMSVFKEKHKARHNIYNVRLDGYDGETVNRLVNTYSTNELTKSLTVHFVKQLWFRRMEIINNITIHELVDIAFFMAFKILRSSNTDSRRFLLNKDDLIQYEKKIFELKIELDILIHVDR